MKRLTVVLIAAVTLVWVCPDLTQAHFGMILPSRQMVGANDGKQIHLDLMFWHPFEGQGMDLAKPAVFGVVAGGKKTDLLNTLKEKKIGANLAWETDYSVSRPGFYAFYLEPTPYFEPAEDKFIIHYTKVCVGAFGEDEGWDKPVGLKMEIVPLSKPYGLYAGNVFQGQVLLNGKAVPGAEVEVEYYMEGQKGQAPNDMMIAQTIKADPNGIFTYAAPRAGWWGFAALTTDMKKIAKDGKDKAVEIGGVIWVKFYDFPK